MYALREQTRERRAEQLLSGSPRRSPTLARLEAAGALPCLSLHLTPLPAERERPFAASLPPPQARSGAGEAERGKRPASRPSCDTDPHLGGRQT